MTTRPQSLAAATATTFTIAPGQSLWACLAPGSTLRVTHGRVTIRPASHSGGPAMGLPTIPTLEANEDVAWTALTPQATWVQIDSATRQRAEVTVLERAPAPRIALSLRNWLQRVFARSHSSAREQGPRGALQPARCGAK